MDPQFVQELFDQGITHPQFLGQGAFRKVFSLGEEVLKVDKQSANTSAADSGGCALEQKLFDNADCPILAPVTSSGTTTIVLPAKGWGTGGECPVNWLTMVRMLTVKDLYGNKRHEVDFCRQLAEQVLTSLSRWKPFEAIANTHRAGERRQFLPAKIPGITTDLDFRNIGRCPITEEWFIIDYAYQQ